MNLFSYKKELQFPQTWIKLELNLGFEKVQLTFFCIFSSQHFPQSYSIQVLEISIISYSLYNRKWFYLRHQLKSHRSPWCERIDYLQYFQPVFYTKEIQQWMNGRDRCKVTLIFISDKLSFKKMWKESKLNIRDWKGPCCTFLIPQWQ